VEEDAGKVLVSVFGREIKKREKRGEG